MMGPDGLQNRSRTAREAVPAPTARWHLRGGLAAPLRRGALVAVPVLVLAAYLVGNDALLAGGAGALFAGFVAFDAPARVRARWQLATAPVIGAAASECCRASRG